MSTLEYYQLVAAIHTHNMYQLVLQYNSDDRILHIMLTRAVLLTRQYAQYACESYFYIHTYHTYDYSSQQYSTRVRRIMDTCLQSIHTSQYYQISTTTLVLCIVLARVGRVEYCMHTLQYYYSRVVEVLTLLQEYDSQQYQYKVVLLLQSTICCCCCSMHTSQYYY